uniref:Protein YIF1 n=1 Tax=Wuchereria bancrofti TaxID=6293 RepID=A0A1I8EUY9_WUCBA
MTDPSWGWNDDSNYNAGYNANQHWQQRQEPWNNQGAYSNQPTTAMPSDKVYNNYYNQQANIPSIPMTANYSQTNQMQSFGMPSQNSYGVGNLPPFSDQFMSEPMLNAAKQIGGQFALTKYLSAFHLKYYFAVDNTYVGKKLGLMLFPFLHQDWTVKYDSSDSPLPPRLDVNAPDLYIPLMAYIYT